MNTALATITQSHRPHQTFRVGYMMQAREFETGSEVLEASRAVHYRMHPKTLPVVRSVSPEVVAPRPNKPPAKFGQPREHSGVYKAKWRAIVKRVAADNDVSPHDLLNSPLRRMNALKRIAIYQIVTETGMTFPQIAAALGYRDHSSVIHHYRLHKAELEKVPQVKRDVLSVATSSASNQSLDDKCAAIVREAALRYGITPAQIYGNQRRNDIAAARRDVFIKLYTDFGMTFTAIGKQVGNKCHTTIAKALGDLVVSHAEASVS